MTTINMLKHDEKILKTLIYVFLNLYTTAEIIRLINGTIRRGWADEMCSLGWLQKVTVNTLMVKDIYLLTTAGINWLKAKNPERSHFYEQNKFLRQDKIKEKIHKHDFEKQHIALVFQKLFNEKFISSHGEIHRPPSKSEEFNKLKDFDSYWVFRKKLIIGIEHERNGKYQIDLLNTFRRIQHSLDVFHVNKVLIFTDQQSIFNNYEDVKNGKKFIVSQDKSWRFSRGADVEILLYEGFK